MQGNLACKFGFASSNISIQYALCHRLLALSVQQKCSLHKESIYEKLNLPPKPKKPMSAFFRFLNQVRPEILKERPDLKFIDASKIAAEKWGNCDSKLKEKFQQQYQEDLKNYSVKKDEYLKSLTPEIKAELYRAELHNVDAKQEREAKKKSKALGKPRPPLSVFFKYLQSKSNEKTNYPNVIEWVKAVSAEWKKTSVEEKAKLTEERKRDYDRFMNDLNIWEKKMIKEGNIDIVRSTSLVKMSKTNLKQKK